ncbi:SDR family NAD(P)-dependent oxidoreductase [Aneurinibacillus migulanus]|uniref:2-deoxy-D-gluconate 3-dehydrogenase n=1 Tax=Aneurinibacillus migulanus TaxID=47500 RepID=A0A0D1VCN3_ANEMI|nr:SDR family oxidoreductase [Aneurinibacillus migulanus]KIV57199.1 2-deoxy-D-gluconate 3-dehydrogenase [Aneurinibacillus migulanus]KON96907.1 2-deoxy-D-gluconate 3-dehydrogenase [Aneurinibacillus migulanus]MED0894269.1 SDR family oxidoreductase [Aneurinibacillus migulanus]MED1619542.1 SDR family oxidoreductase [Aneurinibacillus migulanus]MED4731706.1 SDR family oxidoreductase [Aneurinibacillus migulanus]
MFELKGRKGIITGAVQGLGYAMAKGLHDAGVELVILDISEKVEEVAEAMASGGSKVHAVKVNLLDRHDLQIGFNKALDHLGGELDILINNAGIHDPKPALDLKMESFDRIIEVNIAAVFQLCRLAGEVMIQRGSGKIINIASVLSYFGGYNAAAYSTSKGAIAQLTKSLSNEWAGSGVNVNAIAPGYFETSLNAFIMQDEARFSQLVARIPAGRFGKPEELVGTVRFLASSASDYLNGVLIPVDGGFLGR